MRKIYLELQAKSAWTFTKTAALVIIGDEILSGKVPDENAGYLARQLFTLGWRLCQVDVLAVPELAVASDISANSPSLACLTSILRALARVRTINTTYKSLFKHRLKGRNTVLEISVR